MTTPAANASAAIDQKIKALADWRGKTLAKVRTLIHQADPDIVEEWKWAKATNPGTPVFSHAGIVCTGETYKDHVKLTFAKGAALKRSFPALQLQPRGPCPPRHRPPRRRQDQRVGLQGPHPRRRHAQRRRQQQAEELDQQALV